MVVSAVKYIIPSRLSGERSSVELDAGVKSYFGTLGISTTASMRAGMSRRSSPPDQVVLGGIVTTSGPKGVEILTTRGTGVSFRMVASILFSGADEQPARRTAAARATNFDIYPEYIRYWSA
jgi:hypothetical protein